MIIRRLPCPATPKPAAHPIPQPFRNTFLELSPYSAWYTEILYHIESYTCLELFESDVTTAEPFSSVPGFTTMYNLTGERSVSQWPRTKAQRSALRLFPSKMKDDRTLNLNHTVLSLINIFRLPRVPWSYPLKED